jgi:hypothetical protein
VEPTGVILTGRFSIELLNHPEPVKFTLGPVPVPIMVSMFRGKLAPGELVDDLDTGNDLYREW